MKSIVAEQFAQLLGSQLAHLRAGLQQLVDTTHGVLRVATGCSGSDLVFHVLHCLSDLWRQRLGLDMRIHHIFATELVEWKRRFIAAHWQPDAIFADIEDFASEATQPHAQCHVNVGPREREGVGAESGGERERERGDRDGERDREMPRVRA